MMNTFMIVTIIPACKGQFRGLIYVCPFQIGFPSPFSLARNRMYLGTHLKKELTDLFGKLPRVWYYLFHNTDRVERGC